MSNSSGTLVESTEYMPFGPMRVHTGSTVTNYKYTDQELDPETGLYYYGARYYDPIIGRFISPDSIVQSPANPQTLNRYSYCANNPLIYTDPTGHFGFSDITNFFEDLGKTIWKPAVEITAAAIGFTVCGPGCAGLAAGSVDLAITGSFESAAATAITAAAFYTAGEYLSTLDNPSIGTKVGVHAAAGSVSGAAGAALKGGDIGLGAVVGGISAGSSEYLGQFVPNDYAAQLAGRSLIGGVTGGVASSIYGASFTQGFSQGAITGGFAYMFNHMLHDARGLVYHRHGNNQPNWGDPNETGGPVIREIPPGPGTAAFGSAMNTMGKYYTEALCVSVGAFVTVDTGNVRWGRDTWEACSSAFKFVRGELVENAE
jgi:RHS repeat-associated protein